MSYMHIENLYRKTDFLQKAGSPVYALEKIHGTSAHVRFMVKQNLTGVDITFHAGGESHVNFLKCFDAKALEESFMALNKTAPMNAVVIYGEAYGGKQQKMKETYGPVLKFVAFDVLVDEKWLSVPQADDFCRNLGLDFVYYEACDNTLEALNKQRDADSMQAIRNGMGPGKMREGIVVRPLVEISNEIGERLMVKHKRSEFRETATPREVDPAKAQVIENANAIANEYVVEERLRHVLDKLIAAGVPMEMSSTPKVIAAMQEDVKREASGEIVWSKEAERAVGNKARELYKKYVMEPKV